MSITIRPATAADACTISRVFAASWKHFYRGIVPDSYLDDLPQEHWEEFVRMGLAEGTADYLVAQQEAGIVGAAVFRPSVLERYPDDSELVSLYLLPGQESRGVGRALLTRALALMKERGDAHCVLDVLSGNARALRFYKQHGFEETGDTQQVTLGGADLTCLVLRKAL